jgi:proteasome accessory factor A
VAKYRLLERYADRRGLQMSDPRLAMMDLAYHDVDRSRGLFYLLQDKGMMDRVVTDERIAVAVRKPPQTTRARLRGEFI